MKKVLLVLGVIAAAAFQKGLPGIGRTVGDIRIEAVCILLYKCVFIEDAADFIVYLKASYIHVDRTDTAKLFIDNHGFCMDIAVVFIDLGSIFQKLTAVVGRYRVKEKAGFDSRDHQFYLHSGSSSCFQSIQDRRIRNEIRRLNMDAFPGASYHAQIAHFYSLFVAVDTTHDKLAEVMRGGL